MPGPHLDGHADRADWTLGDTRDRVAWLLENAGEGSVGPQGPAGPAGPEGPEGPEGPQGPAGEDGADGAAGAAGAAGADGKTWHSGAGAPGAGVGVNGDFYLDLTADAYYGPKASGSWAGTGPTSLIGPEGPAGPEGPEGPPGEPGAHEHAGEDITSGEVALARLPSTLIVVTELDAAIAAHEAAGNPHPTYLTQAEADALYSLLGHTHSIYSTTAHNHDATYQPLDADLTALAALATNAAGRSVLILTDPNADRILFWDDSAGAFAHLTPGAGLTLAGTDITAGAAVASVTAGPVSVTTTAQIQLATVSINTLAGRRYKIDASVRFLKDTGTTTRAETLRLRRTDGSGTILTESGGASSAVASSPFGAALTYVDTPGAATPFTWHLSAINFASSTISAALISMNVIELS